MVYPKTPKMASIVRLLVFLFGFAAVVSTSPAPILTKAPPEPTVVARQVVTEFGTYVTTLNISSTIQTVTIHEGIQMTRVGEDVLIKIADPLVSLVSSIMQNNSIDQSLATATPTPSTPSRRRRRYPHYDHEPPLSNLTQESKFDKRVPPGAPTVDNIIPEADTLNNGAEIFRRLAMPDENQAVVLGIVPRPADQGGPAWEELGGDPARDWAAQDINAILAALQIDLDIFFEIRDLILLANAIIEIITVIQGAITLGIDLAQFAHGVYVSAKNFLRNPDSSRSCETDLNAPACSDDNCRGENGACTHPVNKDCVCWNFDIPSGDSYPYDETFLTAQLAYLALSQGGVPTYDDVNPSCYGVATQTSVSQTAAEKDVDNFCSRDISSDASFPFDQNTNDWAMLSVTFQEKFTLSQADCKLLFRRIIDGCDGNSPDNPQNRKHGGIIQHPFGAILKFGPIGFNDLQCNGLQSPNWLVASVGMDKISEFCGTVPLTQAPGQRQTITYNDGTTSQFTFSIAFYQQYTFSTQDCINQFKLILSNCDGNDPNNPEDRKHGGIYINNHGVVMQIMPNSQPAVFPPNQIDTNGNLIHPLCNSGSQRPGPSNDTINAIISYLCGKPDLGGTVYYGPGVIHSGDIGISLTTKLVNAETQYQQGTSVCNNHSPWQGKIIQADCTEALNVMRGNCVVYPNQKSGASSSPTVWKDSIYAYNCVEYDMVAVKGL